MRTNMHPFQKIAQHVISKGIGFGRFTFHSNMSYLEIWDNHGKLRAFPKDETRDGVLIIKFSEDLHGFMGSLVLTNEEVLKTSSGIQYLFNTEPQVASFSDLGDIFNVDYSIKVYLTFNSNNFPNIGANYGEAIVVIHHKDKAKLKDWYEEGEGVIGSILNKDNYHPFLFKKIEDLLADNKRLANLLKGEQLKAFYGWQATLLKEENFSSVAGFGEGAIKEFKALLAQNNQKLNSVYSKSEINFFKIHTTHQYALKI